ncbi:RES family NAD+ phosphorylase [Noviherbaspirillum massiliense]|uniref:RES family NAD+ phosphorylase n=1 Tax=Noviherbaspirillum massiliense TaxID=1465823 RepID=UPI0002D52A1D|nr:RES domain-containing protein [Noviherbaspirillum massiliense]
MQIYRIADARHPIWDGTGAMLMGGRWNSPGKPVIYGSLSFAGAMLEVLVHARIGKVPRTHACVSVEVPAEVSVERLSPEMHLAGWDAEQATVARQIGNRWIDEQRSAILLVRSVVAREEWNAIVNPRHPDALKLVPSAPAPVQWDERLFSGRG